MQVPLKPVAFIINRNFFESHIMIFLVAAAGLAPGVQRVMFFVIIARLPERGAGFREVGALVRLKAHRITVQ